MMKFSGVTMELERWLLGLVVVLAGLETLQCSSRGGACGDDVQAAKNRCVSGYHDMLRQTSADNFYTGMDVEEVRSVCQSLIPAVRCTHNLKVTCPDTEHTDIEVTLADLVPALKMCTYDNFYEVYARNQFCYVRLSVYSEHCFLQYQAQTEGLIADIYIGDSKAIANMCSQMDALISCIGTNAHVNCNQEAAELVPVLVKASVSMSEYCHNDTTTTVQPLSSSLEPMVNDDTQHGRESSYKSAATTTAATSSSLSQLSAIVTAWITLLYR